MKISDLLDITWYLAKIIHFLKRGDFSPFLMPLCCPRKPPAYPAHPTHVPDQIIYTWKFRTALSVYYEILFHCVRFRLPRRPPGLALGLREDGKTVEGSPPIKQAFRFINQLRQGEKNHEDEIKKLTDSYQFITLDFFPSGYRK